MLISVELVLIRSKHNLLRFSLLLQAKETLIRNQQGKCKTKRHGLLPFSFVLLQFVQWKAQRRYCHTGLESKLLPRLCFIYFTVVVLFCGFLFFGFGMDIRG